MPEFRVSDLDHSIVPERDARPAQGYSLGSEWTKTNLN